MWLLDQHRELANVPLLTPLATLLLTTIAVAARSANNPLLLNPIPLLPKLVSVPRSLSTTYSNPRESVPLDLPTVLGILLLFCLALQRVVTPNVPVAPEVILLAQLVWYLWLRPALLTHLEPVPIDRKSVV